MVAGRYRARHRRKLAGALRHGAWLLLAGAAIVAATVLPTVLGGWDAAWPAAIGTAIAALLALGVAVMLPLELIAFVDLHFDREIASPFRGFRFGRLLYTASGRLDEWAAQARLAPLSGFESHDVMDTGEPPLWFDPAAALPTVEHLLGLVRPPDRLHAELEHLEKALRAAAAGGARFYFLVQTRAGFTNAEVHARRSGLARAE